MFICSNGSLRSFKLSHGMWLHNNMVMLANRTNSHSHLPWLCEKWEHYFHCILIKVSVSVKDGLRLVWSGTTIYKEKKRMRWQIDVSRWWCGYVRSDNITFIASSWWSLYVKGWLRPSGQAPYINHILRKKRIRLWIKMMWHVVGRDLYSVPVASPPMVTLAY